MSAVAVFGAIFLFENFLHYLWFAIMMENRENTHVYRILVSVDAGSMMMMMITHTDILLSYLNKSAGWREQIFHRTGNNNLK